MQNFIHNYCNSYEFLYFYLCGRLENAVLHIGHSHSQDTNIMTLSSFHWSSRLHISCQASSLMSLAPCLGSSVQGVEKVWVILMGDP